MTGIPADLWGISHVAVDPGTTKQITCPKCSNKVRVTVHAEGGVRSYTCPKCGHHGTLGSSKEGSFMADTPAVPDSRAVVELRRQAAAAPTYAEQQRLMTAAEEAQTEIVRLAAQEREVDLASPLVSQIVPRPVHEHHTAATDWLGEIPTDGNHVEASNHMIARGTVWYQGLALQVKADADEFVEQARSFAHRTTGAFGAQAETAEQAFFQHVATLRERDERAGLFAQASPMPSQPGDPEGTFTTGGGQDWLPPEATSSNRAPQLQELGAPESQDLTEANDPGVGAGAPDPAVAAQERTGSLHEARGPQDLEAWPRCAKCHQPVAPVEMAHTAKNEPVHGACVGITGKKEGHQMKTAPCPTCKNGRVAVRQAPQPSILDLALGRVAYSGLPQVDQTVDPSDTSAAPTPLPEEVAFPWTIAPGQVENTIGEAEQQIAEREQRKGASLHTKARQAAQLAYSLAYEAFVRQGMAKFDPRGTFDPLVRHATLARSAQAFGQEAAAEAARLILTGGQDDSGWLGDMGQGGIAPGQQDGGNPPSTNLGQPDPVYGYGGDNGNQPLKPYGADEADDVTNNPGQNYQPGQPLQNDLGGRGNSTETAPGGGVVPKTSSVADVEANDPQLQQAARFMRQRRAYLRQQAGQPA